MEVRGPVINMDLTSRQSDIPFNICHRTTRPLPVGNSRALTGVLEIKVVGTYFLQIMCIYYVRLLVIKISHIPLSVV